MGKAWTGPRGRNPAAGGTAGLNPGRGAIAVDATKILIPAPKPPSPPNGAACLVHIYPTGPAMGTRFPLGDAPILVGRGEGCDIRLREDSVSRRHLRIERDGPGYRVTDLQSTNGTYVNEERVATGLLKDGDYLHIGNCICRYLAGGNVEAQYHEEIHRLTIIDALTDVYNRRYFIEFLGHELASAARYRRPLALTLFDIDRFKEVNDQLGHLGGHAALRELAGRVKRIVRTADVVARYGGEEFAVVMPDTNHAQAVQCGERLRRLVASRPFDFHGQAFQVTVSLGVATFTGQDWMTTRELIAQADTQLMRAKQNGRNRVEG
jgi:diguanylate cyclase (GGDEF)-like protein